MEKVLLLVVCVTVSVLIGCRGAAIDSTNHTTPEPPQEYCTDEKDKDFRLAKGEQAPSAKGSCMLVKCEGVEKGKSIFTAIGCGVFVKTEGCNATDYDYTKLYPECCPSEICKF